MPVRIKHAICIPIKQYCDLDKYSCDFTSGEQAVFDKIKSKQVIEEEQYKMKNE